MVEGLGSDPDGCWKVPAMDNTVAYVPHMFLLELSVLFQICEEVGECRFMVADLVLSDLLVLLRYVRRYTLSQRRLRSGRRGGFEGEYGRRCGEVLDGRCEYEGDGFARCSYCMRGFGEDSEDRYLQRGRACID